MAKSVIDEIKAMELKISEYEAQLKDYNKLVEIIVKNEFGMTIKDIRKLISNKQQAISRANDNRPHTQPQPRPAVPQKVVNSQPNSGVQLQGKKPSILE